MKIQSVYQKKSRFAKLPDTGRGRSLSNYPILVAGVHAMNARDQYREKISLRKPEPRCDKCPREMTQFGKALWLVNQHDRWQGISCTWIAVIHLHADSQSSEEEGFSRYLSWGEQGLYSFRFPFLLFIRFAEFKIFGLFAINEQTCWIERLNPKPRFVRHNMLPGDSQRVGKYLSSLQQPGLQKKDQWESWKQDCPMSSL